MSFFEALRTANLAAVGRRRTDGRSCAGRPSTASAVAESVDLMFRMIGGHDRVHLGQARRTLEAVRARG